MYILTLATFKLKPLPYKENALKREKKEISLLLIPD